jgi:trimeric autotransporter adhesin
MASSYTSLPSNAAGVDIAASGHQNSWIAFEDDPAGFEDATLPKRSSRNTKRIKRTTVHRTSSSLPVTLEVLDNRKASEGVDNYYDYSAVHPIEPRAIPIRQVSDESDPYVMRPDILAARDPSVKVPDLDFEGGLITSQNRTISTSNSSSGSSLERNTGRREKSHKKESSNDAQPLSQKTTVSSRSLEASGIAMRGASVDSSNRRGRPSSRTSASQRSSTPSSKSRTSSVRSRSQSHAQSTTARSSTTTTRSQSRSSVSRQSQSRGRSNSSSHQRPPPTRNNHLDRRSRSRSRSASLTRVVNGPSAADTTSVAARSVPSRLPTHNSGTGIATGFTSSLTPRSTYSTSSKNRRSSSSQSPGGRAARSIGPGVSYEARRRGGTQDGIPGLEFVFPGTRTNHKVSEGSVSKRSHRGAKSQKLSIMDKIFGESSQSAKAREADLSSKYVFRSRTLLAATVYHNSATNLWITTINTNQRGVARDPATANRHLRAFSFASEREAREAAIANAPPKMMTDDESHNQCILCQQTFGIFRRSAHCRNCGVCVCTHATCSTTWSAKSVPETYNLKNETHVRVCKSCDSLSHKFQAALMDGSYEDAVALYGTGNVNLRTPFPTRSRREEVLFPVHSAVEGGNIDILRWLVEDHFCPVQIIKAGKPNQRSVSAMQAASTTTLSSSGRHRVPILTSKGRSVLSIAMDGARVQILRYLVVECSVSVHDSTNLQSCLRSLEAALMFMTPPAVAPIATYIPVLSSPTAHHHNKTRPSSTRSGSVRFHDDDVESETEDPSEPTSEEVDGDDPSTIHVSSRAGVDEVEVESRHSHHTRGNKSRSSHRSTKSKMSTRSAPVSSRSRASTQEQEPCGTCILCMDRPVELTGIPCGHEISCSACGKHLLACPVCGGPSASPPPQRRPRSASASSSSSAVPAVQSAR